MQTIASLSLQTLLLKLPFTSSRMVRYPFVLKNGGLQAFGNNDEERIVHTHALYICKAR